MVRIMDGIKKITDRIATEAREEVARIEAEGAARAAEITAEYTEIAKASYKKRLTEGLNNASAQCERLKNVAELEAKKALLTEKQMLLSEVFDRAEKELAALPEVQYVALFARLAAEASRTGDEALVFNATDRTRVGAAIVTAANTLLASQGRTARLTLADEVRDIAGGVIVSGGSIEVNASLTALVEQYKNELSPSIAAILFE